VTRNRTPPAACRVYQFILRAQQIAFCRLTHSYTLKRVIVGPSEEEGIMHPSAVLIEKLFGALDRHDPRAMAECYHSDAVFRYIAFSLRGKREIDAMWRMICGGRSNIRATCEVIEADDHTGRARVVDDYTFFESDDSPPSSGRPVHNVIDSNFRFRDGLIIEHTDVCDAAEWGRMAIGGVRGFLAGQLRFLRSRKARQKLDAFLAKQSASAA
jgi:ketosteroid isomerase-like protein